MQQTDRLPAAMPSRVVAIDAIRGVALVAVILVNVASMVMQMNARAIIAAAGTLDLAITALETVLLLGKARAMLAFLFGVGFALMMLRLDTPAGRYHPYFVRRMLLLAGFGALNQIFLFWGDILVTYALLGLSLPLFARLTQRRLLIAGAVLIALPSMFGALFTLATGAPLPALAEPAAAARAHALDVYATGRYADVIALNAVATIEEHLHETAHTVAYDLSVLGLFLLGLWAARAGMAHDLAAQRALLRRIARLAAAPALLLNMAYVLPFVGITLAGRWAALPVLGFPGTALLGLVYLAVIAGCFSVGAARLQAWLAPFGRMALTNYLLGTGLGGWLIYGYGLGLLPRLSIVGMNGIGLALVGVLIVFSRMWLSRFRLGPLEWLWRRGSQVTEPRRDAPAVP
jgi:uncharacterized protein